MARDAPATATKPICTGECTVTDDRRHPTRSKVAAAPAKAITLAKSARRDGISFRSAARTDSTTPGGGAAAGDERPADLAILSLAMRLGAWRDVLYPLLIVPRVAAVVRVVDRSPGWHLTRSSALCSFCGLLFPVASLVCWFVPYLLSALAWSPGHRTSHEKLRHTAVTVETRANSPLLVKAVAAPCHPPGAACRRYRLPSMPAPDW